MVTWAILTLVASQEELRSSGDGKGRRVGEGSFVLSVGAAFVLSGASTGVHKGSRRGFQGSVSRVMVPSEMTCTSRETNFLLDLSGSEQNSSSELVETS